MKCNLYRIKYKDGLKSFPLRENFNDIEETFNANDNELSDHAQSYFNIDEISVARDSGTALVDNVRQWSGAFRRVVGGTLTIVAGKIVVAEGSGYVYNKSNNKFVRVIWPETTMFASVPPSSSELFGIILVRYTYSTGDVSIAFANWTGLYADPYEGAIASLPIASVLKPSGRTTFLATDLYDGRDMGFWANGKPFMRLWDAYNYATRIVYDYLPSFWGGGSATYPRSIGNWKATIYCGPGLYGSMKLYPIDSTYTTIYSTDNKNFPVRNHYIDLVMDNNAVIARTSASYKGFDIVTTQNGTNLHLKIYGGRFWGMSRAGSLALNNIDIASNVKMFGTQYNNNDLSTALSKNILVNTLDSPVDMYNCNVYNALGSDYSLMSRTTIGETKKAVYSSDDVWSRPDGVKLVKLSMSANGTHTSPSGWLDGSMVESFLNVSATTYALTFLTATVKFGTYEVYGSGTTGSIKLEWVE